MIAYALAGSLHKNLLTDPLGHGTDGQPVFLRDIWPTTAEIQQAVEDNLDSQMFITGYSDILTGDDNWQGMHVPAGDDFEWSNDSTYIRKPPYFEDMPVEPEPIQNITDARVLALLGDSVTTDHISPAGVIAPDSPAGQYLQEQGISPADFNSYGSCRGNHQVMVRGTFANVRLRNKLAPGTEGGITTYFTEGRQVSIFDAAQQYAQENTPLLVIAGAEYGSGSSRDWAAKGTALLGVKAVLAESFERIHRSNLLGMGVLPLQFHADESAESLGIHGNETFSILGLDDQEHLPTEVTIQAQNDTHTLNFNAKVRVDTPAEEAYYIHGASCPMSCDNCGNGPSASCSSARSSSMRFHNGQ